MACDLQARFQKLGTATSDPAPTLLACAAFNRDNDEDKNEIRQIEGNGTASIGNTNLFDTILPSNAGADREISNFAEYENHASTPPIDVPPPSIVDGSEYLPDNGSVYESRYTEPSPLEDFLHNRGPSISFDPEVTLESGHRRALDAPLPKLSVDTRLRNRSILQELSRHSTRSPLARSYSEAEKINFDSVTGQSLRSSSGQGRTKTGTRPPEGHSPYRLLHSVSYNLADDNGQSDPEQGASLTSESTLSPVTSEVHTPVDNNMDCLISPMSSYSPFHHPVSLQESSAWPKPRRQASASRSRSCTLERKMSMRQAQRQGSRTGSRRSTSSSISPATTFLSKFATEDAAPEPDDEGQEVGDYVLGRQIGYGGFSVVREAYTIEGGERVCRAVKIVRKQVLGKEGIENEQLQAEFEHEVGLWRCLAHRHLLPLIAVYVTDHATFCFTKLNTGGTLFDLVKVNRKGLRRDLARRYTYQLASAVRYLHEDMRIVHRDLKLENCLIDLSGPNAAAEGGNLLLCDFGLAEFMTTENNRNLPDPYERAADRPPMRNIGPSATSTSIAGSLQYASPELIMSPAGVLSPVVDMWAFGVVVYALLVGDLPFQHMFQPRVQMMILAGEWNMEALRNAKGVVGSEDEVLELVCGCLQMQSEERWTIGQVLESRWLNGCQEMLEEISENWKL
jgi:hypothetical protein